MESKEDLVVFNPEYKEKDDEESFLVPANYQEPEKVWLKINDLGGLELIDWEVVEHLAEQFNNTPPEKRNHQMLIGKIMVLVREQTRKEVGSGLSR